MTPTLYTPKDESLILLSHYYSDICQVASSFDSPQNPYRSLVADMIRDSPIIFNCAMSMSASHLSQMGYTSSEPLAFQTEAISLIAKGVANIEAGSNSMILADRAVCPRKTKDDLLLGIILLGMTTSWHDPSSLGLFHFHGARQLFSIWIVENDMTKLQLPGSYMQRLIVSSMIYWEVMAACLIDQDTDTFSYLDIFSNQPRIFFSYPCPWTGVGTGVFILLAKCIAVVRKHRTGHSNMWCFGSAISNLALVQKALALIQEFETTQIPSVEEIQETGDFFAPADHLYKIAVSHKLVGILELYRSFPGIRQAFSQPTDTLINFTHVDNGQQRLHSQCTLELAVKILGIMKTIPEDSRTVSIQTLILLSAGSTLRFYSTSDREMVTNWRRFVLDRLRRVYIRLRLQTINQAAAILKEVWVRMDSMEARSSGCESPIMHVHWMDVMVDNKLETILG
ncbi:hnm1-choline permease [Fusarium longipes]|uniref:Hnm1-choline permease n=1 Tax=Fusarium longipes TaxID=694270 RepID=A0A395T246_9HYPO|nr:hnm1-choline permease [Fusarium longipes]